MNADTARGIERIKANGYWREGTTLGEGGWNRVYTFAENWHKYHLYNLDESTVEPIFTIIAKDDETAIKAFSDLFHLGEFAHEVYRVETKATLILEQL